jgi:hypothetical protein
MTSSWCSAAANTETFDTTKHLFCETDRSWSTFCLLVESSPSPPPCELEDCYNPGDLTHNHKEWCVHRISKRCSCMPVPASIKVDHLVMPSLTTTQSSTPDPPHSRSSVQPCTHGTHACNQANGVPGSDQAATCTDPQQHDPAASRTHACKAKQRCMRGPILHPVMICE